MTIDQITELTAALNAATPPPAKKKKAAAQAGIRPVLSADDIMAFTVSRIVRALGLEESGVTADMMIARVRAFEGMVQ